MRSLLTLAMKRSILCVGSVLAFVAGCEQSWSPATSTQVPSAVYKKGIVPAKMIDAGFYYGDSNYHAVTQASDGNVYYVLCTHNILSNARMYRYNPRTGEVEMVGSLNDVLGEDRSKVYPQGKVHCDLQEYKGKLYFTTHCGSYHSDDEDEELGHYPGGHFMSYDLATGEFEDFGIGDPEQGLISMTLDRKHKRMYAMTWPDMKFLYYDLTSGRIKNFGRAITLPGIDDVRSIQGPRSLGVDPRTGNVYWHNMDPTIACYNYAEDKIIQVVDDPNFNRPILDIPIEPNCRVNWRSIRWNDSMQRFYAVMYYSDYLISFEPETKEIEIIDRICAGPDRKSGETTYSSLGFELSPDGKTIYYIGRDEEIGADSTLREELHLVTYDIPLRRYTDHGVIELDDGRRPRYCQALEVGKDGNLYIVCWVAITDLQSEKAKKILEARYTARPVEDEGKPVAEINLVVIKDPLAGIK